MLYENENSYVDGTAADIFGNMTVQGEHLRVLRQELTHRKTHLEKNHKKESAMLEVMRRIEAERRRSTEMLEVLESRVTSTQLVAAFEILGYPENTITELRMLLDNLVEQNPQLLVEAPPIPLSDHQSQNTSPNKNKDTSGTTAFSAMWDSKSPDLDVNSYKELLKKM